MEFLRILFLLFTTHFLIGSPSKEEVSLESLFLTPLIKEGKIPTAQKLAEVPFPRHEDLLIPEAQWPKSYSGFVTVNEEYGTNLFFWYFPAKINSESAPVLFWSDGGPGATLLHSLFNLHGPFKFNQDRKLVPRHDNASLQSEFNVIYLDNPAGVGFSFTKNEAGYAKSGRETGGNVYEFLIQFFQLFPQLRNNEFYNGGASYGGTYATVIAHEIFTNNQKLSSNAKEDETESELGEKLINLQGVIMDSPWIHPLDQVDYGSLLYNSGLISRKSKEHFDAKRDKMVELMKAQKFAEAGEVWFSVALMDTLTHTGLPSIYDVVDQDLEHIALLQHNYTDLITSPQFRTALHVGSSEFHMFSPTVQSKMKDTFMTSVKDLLEELLTSKFRVLMIAGDLDLITGHPGIQDVALGLNWAGGEDFRGGEKQVWMDQNRFAGNIQASSDGLLTYALVRNAGHGAGIYQPIRVLELMKGFVRKELSGGYRYEDENFTDYFPKTEDNTIIDEELKSHVREDL